MDFPLSFGHSAAYGVKVIKSASEFRYPFSIDTTASVKGNWNYHFTANGSALASNTISYFLNQNFTLPDGRKLTFEKLLSDIETMRSLSSKMTSCKVTVIPS